MVELWVVVIMVVSSLYIEFSVDFGTAETIEVEFCFCSVVIFVGIPSLMLPLLNVFETALAASSGVVVFVGLDLI